MRQYNMAKTKYQLHILSEYLEKEYPHYYQEHLDKRTNDGVGGIAIKVMDELKKKNAALGDALVKSQMETLQNQSEKNQSDQSVFPDVPVHNVGEVPFIRDSKVKDWVEEKNLPRIITDCVPVYFEGEHPSGQKEEMMGNAISAEQTDEGLMVTINMRGHEMVVPLIRVYRKL